MEGNTNWKPNEQGGNRDAANNRIDWRSQHEPELRQKVLSKIVCSLNDYRKVEKFKEKFHAHEEYKINDIASKFEENFYSIATDKNDYLRKLSETLHYIQRTYTRVLASQVVVNQAQSLPALLPYMQTTTSQQWLQQNTQSNLCVICFAKSGPYNRSRFSKTDTCSVTAAATSSAKFVETTYSTAFSSIKLTKHSITDQKSVFDTTVLIMNIIVASQDSTGKTVNVNAGNWQEETYQKIKKLKEMCLPVLSLMHQRVAEKLRETESLPPQPMQAQWIEKLKAGKLSMEHLMFFLNVHRSSVSEKHRDKFSQYEYHILKFTKSQTMVLRPTQQQQGQFPPSQTAMQTQSPQVHVSQSLYKEQRRSRLMPSSQNEASSLLQIRPKLDPRDENIIMASSGNVMLPSVKQNPRAVNTNISSVQSLQKQKRFHHRQMQQQQPQQGNHQHQMQTNEMNDVRMRERVNIKARLLEQQVSSSQRQVPKQESNVSSSQIQNHSSPQLVDQHILPATINKTGTPLNSSGSAFVAPAPSPVPGDSEMPISVESPVSGVDEINSTLDSSSKLGTQETPLLFVPPPEPITERPIDRLIKAFQAASPKSLAESVSEISSVISMVDMIGGSFPSSGGSRAGLGEDLSERTRNFTTHEETNLSKRMKRSINIVPPDMSSQIDSYEQLSSLESEVVSTTSSGLKVNNIAPGYALLQEIKETNGRLVETVVEICDEDSLGTIVTCTYAPVALSATFKDHYKSGKIAQIQPLRLLFPMDYPYSSPIVLEEISFDTSVHKYEDLSARTRSRFSLSMKEFSEPGFSKGIAQTWNDCARATMVEYAERHGGGTFSSKYGAWETVLRAS
ncbi:mediator of RNA polymerase II transcription subunit [Arabidopsis thaliana]|uniref:Isoform 2 of Probable mediator of RNA polymerase II transcription subunit 15c n=1 Tax=Arabidopsis thaliana TaxID=3702 RepID=Q9SHV7-2|nr:mediator of RNA polymerase II transcription subunit [Arabidopsis thaliana]AEC06145.1 mediator of RNA polymerase II transcription subunit [Arabidopsis thaliana]|eukprot:NP_001154512.1 mediator of RNA polymerase II transcription subunit [Arabidopsis thaliana]